ncbi:MAG: sensor histidine kinase [Magnetovibrionaceae bacterium]
MTSLLSSKKLRPATVIAVSLVALSLAVTIWHALATSHAVRVQSETAMTFAGEMERKTLLIKEIRTEIGFGGLIHNFQTYVLRGGSGLRERLRQNFSRTYVLLEDYGSLSSGAAEHAALDRLKLVIDSYNAAFDAVSVLKGQGADIRTIDQAIMVNDRPALEALDELTALWLAEEKTLRAQLIEQTEDSSFYARASFIMVPLVLVFAGLLYWLIRGLDKTIKVREAEVKERAAYAADLEMGGIMRDRQAEELAALAEQLETQRHQLDEANRQKDLFFSIIAHDLRSPFTALLGYAQILALRVDHLPPEKIKEMTQDLETAAKRAFGLVENLLVWGRVQMGNHEFDPQPISLATMGRTCMEQVTTQAEEKGITVEADLPDVTAYADPDQVAMVLRNLVTNALKFTESGGTISISGGWQDGMAVVHVADTGLGMSASKLETLFDIGVKSSTPGTRGERGSGLGLPLARDFVLANGGDIWVDSTEGEGTTFTFTLPVHEPAATAEGDPMGLTSTGNTETADQEGDQPRPAA